MSTEYFQMEPLGVGHSEVESFGSFYTRFCSAHSVTPAVMSRHVREWSLATANSFETPVRELFNGDRGSPTGISDATERFVAVLTAATGCQSLMRTTLLALKPAFTRNDNLVTWDRAWCPACFNEHLTSSTPPYERLLWSIPLVRRCHIHKVALETKCPACGAKQPHHHRAIEIGRCVRCMESLVPHHSSWNISLEPDRYEKGCVEIVEAVSSGALESCQDDAYLEFLYELGRQLDERSIPFLQVLDRRFRRPHIMDGYWTVHCPSFLKLMDVCLTLEVSPVDVLSDPVGAAGIAVLQSLDRVEAQQRKRPIRPASFLTRAEQRLRRDLVINDFEKVSTLASIAAELGVSEGYLRHRLEALVLEHGRHRRRCKTIHEDKKMRRALEFLRRGPMRAYPSASYPSQDHLAIAVRDKLGIGIGVARRAIATLLKVRRK